MKANPEKYQSNEIVILKREALIAADVETLRLIRSFEAKRQLFFKLTNEDVIRDHSGKAVDLPYSVFEQIQAFRPLQGQIVELPAGVLIDRIKSDQVAMVITELPENTTFPVEITTGENRVSGRMSVISGIGFYQVTPSLVFIRADDLSQEQLDSLMQITDRLTQE